jgi:hypothetical protein
MEELNLARLNLNELRLGLSKNGVDRIRPDCPIQQCFWLDSVLLGLGYTLYAIRLSGSIVDHKLQLLHLYTFKEGNIYLVI